ncbi:NADH dehydrogenase, C subunit [Winkia neuii]|uniref:NADH-quinone oxidoreductase subunit C n=1 Tax=Winkia neuii TaxID=33007 RepID=UPI000764360F|nr:NADH-quinone oxidoreductase subunit C [Winkia neuii]KWZ74812.1 NADH dehydrogenase, C subunit [Winkia neuii]
MSENNIVPSHSEGSPERANPNPELIGVRQGLFHVADAGDTTGFGGLEQKVFLPGESTRPYGGWFDSAVDALEEDIREAGLEVGKVIERVVVDRDELTLYISRENIVQICQMLRDDQDLRFEMCLGVNGVHYPQDAGRELHACYMLLSFTHGRQLRLEVSCPEDDPKIPSVVSVYPGNDWHERETWDLMGIVFTGHPSLTRTALPDDWVGHPQRKDYPLGGIPVEYKGATVPPADVRRSYN